MQLRRRLALAILLSLFLAHRGPEPAVAQGNPVEALGGALTALPLARGGTPAHAGSWSALGRTGDDHCPGHAGNPAHPGENEDFCTVEPGETLTLFDHKGAGIVHRFWMTLAPFGDEAILRQAILRMYWDGEARPSVEVPLGDFFGVGFGQQVDYVSLPLSETSGGFNCYWPMPFHRSARWTLTNWSGKRIDNFYWNIDYTAYESLSRDLLHFHAQWRRENPTGPGDYTILDTSGRGHFVGAALFLQNRTGGFFRFLEGDERVYVDGAATPSVLGTGTEDYLGGGYYFKNGPYSAPYHGAVIVDSCLQRVSAYRWHIEDAMPYSKSIRVTIEHGSPGEGVEGDYSSVAYFYQMRPPIRPDLVFENLLPCDKRVIPVGLGWLPRQLRCGLVKSFWPRPPQCPPCR